MTALLDLLHAPQLGEFAWHQVTADPGIDDMSRAHYAVMAQMAQGLEVNKLGRPLRVLELGAYRHYAGHLLAEKPGAELWLSDISAQALREGRRLAKAAGITRFGDLCTADFHDLPFVDGWFDLVFIASAVHHTRRPECVLREMLRVLRPGGVLRLQNEPVAREFCAYAFNSNRDESFTRLEAAISAAGLMRTVSSPFYGTRPEEMFQMVENDRIPLDLYLHELTRDARLDELELDTGTTVGALEQRVLDWVSQDPSCGPARVATHLNELNQSLPEDDDAANAMGFRGLFETECWTLAQRLARHAAAMAQIRNEDLRLQIMARLFGAALRARVVKTGGVAAQSGPFRRELNTVDGVTLDIHGKGGGAYLGLRPELADVSSRADATTVRETFSELGWDVIEEAFEANSLYNLSDSAGLPLPKAACAILLLRVYTVPAADPYRIIIRQAQRTVAEAVVAQAESRLLRGIVYRDAGPVRLEHQHIDGRPMELTGNLRVAVLQLLSEI